jgi:starvation-inducible DNA-binding protein
MRKHAYALLVAGILGTVALIVAQEVMVHPTHDEKTGLGLEPNIGLNKNSRQAVSNMLNTLLADEYLLYVKTQNYHWNVTGLMFNDLHNFFGKQYKELADIIDSVAERVRALGECSHGTMQEFLDTARLKETPGVVPGAKHMIKNLLEDHEAIIRTLRENIDETANEFEDTGTNSFLSDLITQHEKMAWMLRAYIS